MKQPDATLFCGPSSFGLDLAWIDERVRRQPPARRGDIDRLREASEAPATIVLCDGVFQSTPAVSHAELCRAIDAGWQVWGVSSLGAIRAWELRAEGMQGFGRVHATFGRIDDFTDDEMCLLHFPEAPYFPLSEPLVNVRHALADHADACGIGQAAADRLVDSLRSSWFGDRTHDRMRRTLLDSGVEPGGTDAWLGLLAAHRVKQSDLLHLLECRPWMRDPAG